MSLSMQGHIDATFKSVDVLMIYEDGGGYVDGIWQDGAIITESYTANVQPLNLKELDFIFRGGERIVDPRKIYINSGDYSKLELGQKFQFLNQFWKIIQSDIRPWRNYAKIIVSRFDDQ